MATYETAPKGPYKLVTVNTAPERAQRLIGLVTKDLADQYTIIHAANCATKEEVDETIQKHEPDLLCCASMWTAEESEEIRRNAKIVRPQLKTYAIPQGLQVKEGPQAIVEHLKKKLPELIESN
ncbi:hypothetical protein BJ878DRAFT_570689 [Calycina marina]|uniref:Uncharacterized protein n=1 Tax=Calycina marina TaxID=1763456 RepID=A0A9P8CD19_9HELO|nr:hypothetical protein BJ878DRAFT_570689 [Calycina marina]